MKSFGPAPRRDRGRKVFLAGLLAVWAGALAAAPAVLTPDALRRHVGRFNAMEDEPIVNVVPNADAARWLEANIPLFSCPDADVEEIYFFRWWALRKHLRRAPDGSHVFTEFITRADPVSSALGHHLMEGRWLHERAWHDDYVRWWLRSNGGQPHARLHAYSQWLADALYQRFKVTHHRAFVVSLLDDLVADYRQWESEKLVARTGIPGTGIPGTGIPGTATAPGRISTEATGGGRGPAEATALFWQYDVRDAMEESISGSRTKKNVRPTINSYMYGNARAIAAIARLASQPGVAAEFDAKADTLRRQVQALLWNEQDAFFEVRLETGGLANVREAIGFIPWYFHLPEPGRGYERAWRQFTDDAGFRAPFGITTAERRHPQFRSHGVGTCEWDGAVWPFATSQTLTALGHVLRDYPQESVTVRDYFEAFRAYVRSHRMNGKPYIGEYLDERTGAWLKGDHPRSRWYNHSTFADLVIGGVVGLRPRVDDTVEVHPLLPAGTWDWFALDDVRYHERTLTILWDRDGKHFGRGAGLQILIDGKEAARAPGLQELTAELK